MNVKIGFEIHVQLKTESKLFCKCSTRYWESEPNTNVCPVCTGLPGSKPFPLNKKALEQAIKVALSLGMKVNPSITVLRKHYFYPDLPSGYQRTSTPLGVNGKLNGVRIRELHIEEDPGRYEPRKGLVDFNRSGVPLIEIVTEPDINSVEEAEAFLRNLHTLLTYLDVVLNPSIVFRVDANVSVEGGERVEIKNINTIEGVKKALSFEIIRQKKLIEQGQKVKRETKHWDEERNRTVTLREKETEEDYRYMPDPDVPVVVIDEELVEKLKETLPELPWERENRYVDTFGIDRSKAHAIVSDRDMAEYFEAHISLFRSPKFWADFLADRVKGELNYRGKTFSQIHSKDLYVIALAWEKEEITKEAAIEILRAYIDEKIDDVKKIIEQKRKLSEEELMSIINDLLSREESLVKQYREGNRKVLNVLIGKVVSATKGRADPRTVKDLIEKILNTA